MKVNQLILAVVLFASVTATQSVNAGPWSWFKETVVFGRWSPVTGVLAIARYIDTKLPPSTQYVNANFNHLAAQVEEKAKEIEETAKIKAKSCLLSVQASGEQVSQSKQKVQEIEAEADSHYATTKTYTDESDYNRAVSIVKNRIRARKLKQLRDALEAKIQQKVIMITDKLQMLSDVHDEQFGTMQTELQDSLGKLSQLQQLNGASSITVEEVSNRLQDLTEQVDVLLPKPQLKLAALKRWIANDRIQLAEAQKKLNPSQTKEVIAQEKASSPQEKLASPRKSLLTTSSTSGLSNKFSHLMQNETSNFGNRF